MMYQSCPLESSRLQPAQRSASALPKNLTADLHDIFLGLMVAPLVLRNHSPFQSLFWFHLRAGRVAIQLDCTSVQAHQSPRSFPGCLAVRGPDVLHCRINARCRIARNTRTRPRGCGRSRACARPYCGSVRAYMTHRQIPGVKRKWQVAVAENSDSRCARNVWGKHRGVKPRPHGSGRGPAMLTACGGESPCLRGSTSARLY
jgi:hypothetical protein